MDIQIEDHDDPELDQVATWIGYTCLEGDDDLTSQDGESDTSEEPFLDLSTFWNVGETVTYCFLAGRHQGNAVQHKKVAQVVRQWEKYANIHFQEVKHQSATIRITFNPRSGSWSKTGTAARDAKRGDPTMNLGPVKSDTDEPTQLETGYILHEFGHVIGLGHEHQSPFMDGELKVAAITRYYKTIYGMSDKWISRNITRTYKREDLSSYSAFDSKSIMMYPMPQSMYTDGALKRYPHLVDEHFNNPLMNCCLSEIDIAYTIIHYPHPEPQYGWSFERALRVAGVKGRWAAELNKLRKQKNYARMRTRFSIWNQKKQYPLTEHSRVQISAEMKEFEEKERARIAALLDPRQRKKEEWTMTERMKEHQTWSISDATKKYAKLRAKAVSLALSTADTLFGRFTLLAQLTT